MGNNGICQMFYTSEIPKVFNFTQKNAQIATFLANNLECLFFFFIYFEQLVSLFANLYSNTTFILAFFCTISQLDKN